jgi:DMSO/TMAO reductase YedYZ molybdopterin-dependent catalytic subunit
MKLFGGPRYPEEIARRVPPGNRLVKGWPVLHYGPVPRSDGSDWTLRLHGLVENEHTLAYDELKALGPESVTADMHCVTGWTTLDNVWEGVPFRVLAERARPRPEAAWVTAHSEYGYASELSLQAMMDDDVLVAWGHGGAPLEPHHGFPLRLVVPKRYAWKSAKWLRSLEFTERNERGFWEVRGYHVHADPWREERYAYEESTDSEDEP